MPTPAHVHFDRGVSLAKLLPVIAVLLVAGCKEEAASVAADPRPVRTITVERKPAGETVVLTGRVESQDEAALGFRIGGRMIERTVNVGDKVTAGQVLARLDPQNETNAVRLAEAALSAARGNLTTTRDAFARQQTLRQRGLNTRTDYDNARQAQVNAQAAVDDANARLRIARDQLGFTVLSADTPGSVTARGAEPGEVVQAGQMIVRIARQGGRDAVFDVPANVLRAAPTRPRITIRLSDDAEVVAEGVVREVAPQADPRTGTFPVRVTLVDPPEAMRLGSVVIGRMESDSEPVISVPATALTKIENQPAVWVVDPADNTVSLRNVEVLRHSPESVVIAKGLEAGDVVVTAGVHALHPGQPVRLLVEST